MLDTSIYLDWQEQLTRPTNQPSNKQNKQTDTAQNTTFLVEIIIIQLYNVTLTAVGLLTTFPFNE